MRHRFVKRAIDLVGATLALIVLSPVLLTVAALVRIRLGSPVLFRQLRPGRHGRPFEILKFRTMTDDRDPDGQLLPNEKRLTAFGRRLRRTSLDELPELINVVRGEMSLVGPRPLRMEYLPLYSAEQQRRHEVRPGLTGLAQIEGRNLLSWEERFRLDVQYADNHTLLLDAQIVFRTVVGVLRADGVNSETGSFMEPFSGSSLPTEETHAPLRSAAKNDSEDDE
jgi:sugar transferase EpsL